jgi:hypothetical protein
MINLYYNGNGRGPGKVVDNLILGLQKLNVPFRLNPNEDNSWVNFILQEHSSLYSEKIHNSIIGPNICVLPIDNSVVMSQSYKKIIVPSEWVKNLYMKWIPEDKIHVWPAGINTEKFYENSKQEKEIDCLIYFKRRSINELNLIKNFLQSKNLSFVVIEYGSYNEETFLTTIHKSKFGFILNNTESQGIAVQEIMSCNLPLMVWDVQFWEDRGDENKVLASSVPYWDKMCGEKYYTYNEITNNIDNFILNLSNYTPRKFILENLNIIKTTEMIIKLI